MIDSRGALFANSERVEISDSLNDPAFWAIQLSLHLDGDEIENPHQSCFGLTTNVVLQHYERIFGSRWMAGSWPYIRIPSSGGRYLEIEYAAGTEHQTRFWIGEEARSRRVLLGYDSGNFSLPAFRAEEICSLSERLAGHPALPLLILPAAYLSSGESFPADRVEHWLAAVPGIENSLISLMADVLVASLLVPGLEWQSDPSHGWINNGIYSQRNPASLMSMLSAEDFVFVREYFLYRHSA